MDRLAEIQSEEGSAHAAPANGAPQSHVIDVPPSSPELDHQLKIYQPIKEIFQHIQKTNKMIRDLTEKEKKAASEEDRRDIVRTMNGLVQDSNSLSLDVKRRLDVVRAENVDHAKQHPGAATTQMRYNFMTKYMREFSSVISNFNDASESFKVALNDRTRRQLRTAKVPEPEIERVVASGQAQEVLEALMSDEVKDVIDQIHQRHSAILQLESSIQDIQQMFVDLAHMVDLQQESINNIESHVLSAKDYVHKGETHLNSASTYQDKARKRQCCFILIIMIVIGVVLGPTLSHFLG